MPSCKKKVTLPSAVSSIGKPIEHKENYVGRRKSRGLFQSANGPLINADVNGAYNIIKKAIPKAFADGIDGVGLHPERWIFVPNGSISRKEWLKY